MSARTRRLLTLTLMLVAPSAALHLLELVLFPDPQAIWMALLSQLAFLPLFYLFSTIVIDSALTRKEKEGQMRRTNVLVGVFFHELGEDLLRLSIRLLVQQEECIERMHVVSSWKEVDFLTAIRQMEAATYRFHLEPEALESLADLVGRRRNANLQLMQNPGLLEHEGFTELVLAVSHLCDEFNHRPSMKDLPGSDIAHIEGDLRRVFVLLTTQWLRYALHLKKEYPYLYSLILRVGPCGTGSATVS